MTDQTRAAVRVFSSYTGLPPAESGYGLDRLPGSDLGGEAGWGGIAWIERSLNPLWQRPVPIAVSPRELECVRCEVAVARRLNAAWHSRLPHTQTGPWQFAFAAHKSGIVYAVALWHNPSARTLPGHWLELRRLAIAPDAPRYTASWMLGRMRHYFKAECPERERLISYQDAEVHAGTIYKAAGWRIGYVAKARTRDRTKPRRNTRRDYRSNQNGAAPDSSTKIRWEVTLA